METTRWIMKGWWWLGGLAMVVLTGLVIYLAWPKDEVEPTALPGPATVPAPTPTPAPAPAPVNTAKPAPVVAQPRSGGQAETPMPPWSGGPPGGGNWQRGEGPPFMRPEWGGWRGRGDGGGGDDDQGRRAGFMRMMGVTEEQQVELEELRRNNPDAFRERLREMFEQMRTRREEEENRVRSLADAVRDTGSEAAKSDLRAQLLEQYDRRLERERQRLAVLKAECDRLEATVRGMEQDRDASIERYLAELEASRKQ